MLKVRNWRCLCVRLFSYRDSTGCSSYPASLIRLVSSRQAFGAYQAALEGGTTAATTPRPLPQYIESAAAAAGPSDPADLADTQYELLSHYSARQPDAEQLTRLLRPAGASPNPLDACLSWHLLSLMQGLEVAPVTDLAGASLPQVGFGVKNPLIFKRPGGEARHSICWHHAQITSVIVGFLWGLSCLDL